MKILNALLIIYFFCALAKAQSPNFLIVHLDDEDFMGQDYTLCAPNIKALQNKALYLENLYSQVPSESVAEILCGKFAGNLKNIATGGDISVSEPCIAKSLADFGYKSAYIGKWRNAKSQTGQPYALGFNFFYGVLDSEANWPYDWQKKAAEKGKLKEKDIKMPNLSIVCNGNIVEIPAKPNKFLETFTSETLSFISSCKSQEKPFFVYLNYASSYAEEVAKEKFFPTQDKENLKKYCNALDSSFGKILKSLERQELLENTMIIFISKAFLKKNIPNKNSKNLASESFHKIPTFVHFPKRFKEPKSLDAILLSSDIFDFIKDSASAFVSKNSMLGYMLGLNDIDDKLVLYYSPYKEIFALRDGDFKLLLDKPKRGIEMQLYDLTKDPIELNNLAPSMESEAQALKKKCFMLDSAEPKVFSKEETEKKKKILAEKAKELEKQKKKEAKEKEKALKKQKEKERQAEKALKKQSK